MTAKFDARGARRRARRWEAKLTPYRYRVTRIAISVAEMTATFRGLGDQATQAMRSLRSLTPPGYVPHTRPILSNGRKPR